MNPMFMATRHRRAAGSAPALAGPVSGRLRISGGNFVDANGNVVILRGFRYGHMPLMTIADLAEDVSLGANFVSLPFRVWGEYGLPNFDESQPGAPGNMIPASRANLIEFIKEAKLAGLYVSVFGDSNCGMNDNGDPGGGDACDLTGSPAQNFWTTKGEAKLAEFIGTWTSLASDPEIAGMIDLYEVGAEPGATGVSQADTRAVMTQISEAITAAEAPLGLTVGPIFLYGPKIYFIDNADQAYDASRPAATQSITGNLLSDALIQPDANVEAKVDTLVSVRATRSVPVEVNQIGTRLDDDPDLSRLTLGLTLLQDNDIGFSIWEKVSVGAVAYGPYWDGGSGRTVIPAKLALCEAAFRGEL